MTMEALHERQSATHNGFKALDSLLVPCPSSEPKIQPGLLCMSCSAARSPEPSHADMSVGAHLFAGALQRLAEGGVLLGAVAEGVSASFRLKVCHLLLSMAPHALLEFRSLPLNLPACTEVRCMCLQCMWKRDDAHDRAACEPAGMSHAIKLFSERGC